MIAFDNKATTRIDSTSGSLALNNQGNFVVAIIVNRNSGQSVSGTPTYGGQNMTRANNQNNTSEDVVCDIWYLANAPTGNNTFNVSFNNSDDSRVTLASFSGVKTSSPLNVSAKANSNTVNITPTVDDCLIVAGVISETGSGATAGSGETLLYGQDEGVWGTGSEYVIKSGGANSSHTMNFGGVGTDSAIVAVAFEPEPTGTDTNDERDALATGSLSSSTERASAVTGTATVVTSERDSSLFANSSSSSERAGKIYAGFQFTVSDDFSTTTNKDSGNTTAQWNGDGEVTL